ncbi:MAG: FMN-binding glutamate synthase family protein [Epsilonproteobacteria bacterium]|nr:FMN-binding glutamate synthase family protein [Campylobacterota bacterium]
MVESLIFIVVLILFLWYLHDRFVQRNHSLLINYPIIGRLRYFLETIREPFRQYFGDEDVFDSRDKIEWVYKAARDKTNYISFSPSNPQKNPKFMLKHAFTPRNDDEVEENFAVTFGADKKIPFTSNSIISRSGMSDGSISPEGTQAFAIGAFRGKFPINTGEGGLTSNFLITHRSYNKSYMSVVELSAIQTKLFKLLRRLFNTSFAIGIFKKVVLAKGHEDTYGFDREKYCFYRVNWSADLDQFPKSVPTDVPDTILQIGSGLYGVRDKEGNFDPIRYQKVMRFCRMTEIKIAQGAKQTGGKLTKNKVTEAIAYYRGVQPHQDLFSPNRFPFANSIEELFDFIQKLQKLSDKPVGFKIVISDKEGFEPIAKELKRRLSQNQPIPDFISVDGGEGGSATAPIELMERVGLNIKDALFLVDEVLTDYGVRDKIKLIASGKVLTPDNVIILVALGADMVGLARGFMMSAGCIRARVCSGAGKHQCPVGLATQDKTRRKAYIVHKYAQMVENYHNNIIKNVKVILAIMGLTHVSQLTKEHLMFVDDNGNIRHDIKRVMDKKVIEDTLC